MMREHVVISFNDFKKTCKNYAEICEAEEIVDEKTFQWFCQNRLYYGFPERGEKFKLVRLPGYTEWVAIDYGLADIIVYLNEHGYPTKYCCEGHKYEGYRGYLFFSKLPQEKESLLLKKMRDIEKLPEVRCTIEPENRRGIIFRFTPKGPKTPEAHERTMKILREKFSEL